MDVSSLGFRTDLALLRLGGSHIDDHGDHLVVRSPDNPTHWWGNFLLLAAPPPAEHCAPWLTRFTSEFPHAGHVALGFDGTDRTVAELGWFTAQGLTAEAQAVMMAERVQPPPRRNGRAVYRPLTSEQDWLQSVELRFRCDAGSYEPTRHRAFVTAKTRSNRDLVAAGHGAWFGAFDGTLLVAQAGLFTVGPGLARFQQVETDPDHRRRGLAGSLLHHVGRYGFDTLDASTLVIVADPDYFAIDLYRALGFTTTETQLQVEGPPTWGRCQVEEKERTNT
jgi:ribosomal protein S18 acetylase RimI-like enzyme